MWDELQDEHRRWLEVMFPGQKQWEPAACMVEEAGEMLHCMLKLAQTKRLGAEERYRGADFQAKLIDALGDCAISACSWCSASLREFSDLMRSGAVDWRGSSTLQLAAQLIEFGAKLVVSPNCYLYAAGYASTLRALAEALDVNLEQATLLTWQEVKERKR